jgi:hypothetical protein
MLQQGLQARPGEVCFAQQRCHHGDLVCAQLCPYAVQCPGLQLCRGSNSRHAYSQRLAKCHVM